MATRLVFFGNERIATGTTTDAPVLRFLIEQGYEISAVILAQNETGKSRKARPTEIVQVAEAHDIPVLSPASLKDIHDELTAIGAQAAVLVAYGKLVPQSIIDIFPSGIINVHPSLLPKHRGSIPIEAAILEGELSGVSLMQLAAKMDAGPVYAQSDTISVKQPLTKQQISELMSQHAVRLLEEHLAAILDGSLRAHPQDETAATYDKRIQKQDSILDFNKSAVELEREIRAYAGWPRSKTVIAGRDVIVTKATLLYTVTVPGQIETNTGQLVITCKWGSLQIDSLIPAGKKEMSGPAFIAGYLS